MMEQVFGTLKHYPET